MATGKRHRIVIGMGKTGLSCARFLQAAGEAFVWCDTRTQPPALDSIRDEFPATTLHCGELDPALLCAAGEIVVSPGVSLQEPALVAAGAAGVPLVGDIELFVRATRKPVIAITGSNAKSTVTTLVGEMASACGLRAGVGGNLGTPVLDMLRDDAQTDCYVLELSSFQLETTWSLQAQVATILNVSEDHMDRYNSLPDYVAAKQRIYRGCAHALFNRADEGTLPVPPAAVCWSFGLDVGDGRGVGVAEHEGAAWLVVGEQPLLPVAAIRLAGRHNLANVAAAMAIACAAGWDLAACAAAVSRFNGLPHRCAWVAEKHGVRYYNDSKGTNIGATVAAIEGLATGKNVLLIAGGEGKGADFRQLAPVVREHVKQLVLIGRDAQLIADACSGVANTFAGTLVDAVQQARQAAVAGDVVLLSPACASFDMFNGYDDRGRQFCAAVEALA